MMEQIDKIIDILLNNFDIAYMLCVNVLTYGLIKFIDIINKEKKVKLLVKRICLLGCTLVCCAIYKLYTDIQPNILINSTIAAPVFYSWVMKPLLTKYNIGYKKDV